MTFPKDKPRPEPARRVPCAEQFDHIRTEIERIKKADCRFGPITVAQEDDGDLYMFLGHWGIPA